MGLGGSLLVEAAALAAVPASSLPGIPLCPGIHGRLRRAPSALEGTFSRSAVRSPSGGEGLPKVCCRRPSRFGHLCIQWSTVCGFPLHSGHVGSAVGSNKWTYALIINITASARFQMALQFAFHEKFSYNMAVSDGASDEGFRGGK